MSDRSRTAITSTEDEYGLHVQAFARYHTDAEFHAEVYQAVRSTLATYDDLYGVGNFAREVAMKAVAFALSRRDGGREADRG